MGFFVKQFREYTPLQNVRDRYILQDQLTAAAAASGNITVPVGKSLTVDIVAIATVKAKGTGASANVGDTFACRERVTVRNVTGTAAVVTTTGGVPWVDADASMTGSGLAMSAATGSLVVSYSNPSTIGTGTAGIVAWAIEADVMVSQ